MDGRQFQKQVLEGLNYIANNMVTRVDLQSMNKRLGTLEHTLDKVRDRIDEAHETCSRQSATRR